MTKIDKSLLFLFFQIRHRLGDRVEWKNLIFFVDEVLQSEKSAKTKIGSYE